MLKLAITEFHKSQQPLIKVLWEKKQNSMLLLLFYIHKKCFFLQEYQQTGLTDQIARS